MELGTGPGCVDGCVEQVSHANVEDLVAAASLNDAGAPASDAQGYFKCDSGSSAVVCDMDGEGVEGEAGYVSSDDQLPELVDEDSSDEEWDGSGDCYVAAHSPSGITTTDSTVVLPTYSSDSEDSVVPSDDDELLMPVCGFGGVTDLFWTQLMDINSRSLTPQILNLYMCVVRTALLLVYGRNCPKNL